ncbi:DUF928 domain-containing protein [Anabaena sphaerica FACHB-251]|uniref:DUF928 domain-containing protein n=1 Tax=Anabaena sphaerica FACHB-251 TaxID=2692883 RepID=A0A926WGP8_9NOST|nr:DUF928 domain-containing protein [Anabaena sphaerica]MBD2293141.1 DUF928 domain-containing protein [Anabaena sphaerica FACHB-251]
MNLPKYFQYPGKVVSVILPGLLVTSLLPGQLLAQSAPMKISLEFPSGDPRGTPASTLGGGRRGVSCLTIDKGKPSLTALMPKRDNKSLTATKTPEFYFYVPKTTASTAEFILREGEEDIYDTTFKLPGKSGIVKLQIPPTSALKTGSTYKWYLTIICNPDDRSADEYIHGVIERTAITPSLSKALQQATPLKQAKIYAQYALWPETITKIAQLRTEKPNEWKELLKSVGLEVIASEELFDCCQPDPKP